MAWSREATPDHVRRWLPALVEPGLGGLDVGDGALEEVNVEAQEVEVIHCFKFDGVAEKVVVDEGLDGWV